MSICRTAGAAGFSAAGRNVLGIDGDVGEKKRRRDAVAAILDRFGGSTRMVFNPGIMIRKPSAG